MSSTGVHMYDIGKLLGFLTSNGLLRQNSFSMPDYAACVSTDFDAYLKHYIDKIGQAVDAQHCENLRQRVQAQLAETSMHPIGV